MSGSEDVTFYDIAVGVCPKCGTPVAGSGDGVDLGAEAKCFECDEIFSLADNLADRAIVRITLSKNNRIKRLGVVEKKDIE